MTLAFAAPVDWQVRGSYFEGCNCDAICPCRSVRGRPGGVSTYGECFGALSWYVLEGQADGVDLADLRVALSIRYHDNVEPSTRWAVVLYVDERADNPQHDALAAIFRGKAGGTVANQYGPAIGDVYAVRRARINLEHVEARKRIDVIGYLLVEAEEEASGSNEVRCGIPGHDHPGTDLFGEVLRSVDRALRWEVRGRRNASFCVRLRLQVGRVNPHKRAGCGGSRTAGRRTGRGKGSLERLELLSARPYQTGRGR
jgi:hypothetical protein